MSGDLTFRTDDLARWGTGKGEELTLREGDLNFWWLYSAVLTLQSTVAGFSGGIISIELVSANQIQFNMSDYSVQGPFTIPTAVWKFRGDWVATTVYYVNDIITYNGSVYLVTWPHTSASSFDPNANDGLGHNYYALLISPPGTRLPIGGTTGQKLVKVSNTDLDVDWADDTLAGLSDVALDLSSLSTGDMIQYNGTHWVNTDPASFLGALTIEELMDVAVDLSSVADGQVLIRSGSSWANDFLAFTNITGVATPAQYRNAVSALSATTGTVSIDPTLADIFTVTPTGSITLNAASAPAGSRITLIVTTSGTSSFNITPNTNFKSTGALATGTVSAKVFTITFVGDGTNMCEVARTTAM